jgi:outer membrane protein TolC
MIELAISPGSVARFVCCVLISLSILIQPALANSVDNSWPALIDEMQTNNPGLIAMERQVSSLEQLPESKMAWMDPTISIGLMNVPTDSYELDQEGMTQKIIGIGQAVPSLKKRRANRDAAESNVKIASARRSQMVVIMLAKLRKTVNEIVFSQKALEILQENELIIDEFVRIASSKYSVGKGVQANVLQAQVERSKLIDRRLKLTERLQLAKIRANTLLGRDPVGEFFAPVPYEINDAEVVYEKLWEKASVNSPSIALAQAALDKSRSRTRQAEGMTGMNLMVGAQYGQREDGAMSRPDFLSIKAAVTVPLWRSKKQDKIIASSRIGVESKIAMLAGTVLKVKSELARTVESYRKDSETIELYLTGFIPQAGQAVESAMAAYRLDKIDFLTLLSSEISLLRFELGLEKSIMRKRNLSAKIAALTGEDFISGGSDERK